MAGKRDFGSVHKRGSTWYARWTEDGKRRKKGGFPTKGAATTYLAQKQVQKDQQRATPGTTFEMLKDLVLRTKKPLIEPVTYHREEQQLEAICEHWKGRCIEEVTPAEVQQWVSFLSEEKGYAASTIHVWMASLSGALTVAVENGLLAENPCKRVKRPKIREKAIPYLTPDEVDKFVQEVPEDLRNWVVLLVETGMRRRECEDLRWQHVAEDYGTITVAKSKNTKTRVIPTTPGAVAVLKAQRAEDDKRAHVFDQETIKRTGYVGHCLKRAAKKAGLPHISPHVLRHTFAVHLVRAGVDLPTVSRLLGHTNLRQTMRYADHVPTDSRVNAIASLHGYREARKKAGLDSGD